ncbi:MAG: hypothetical protein AAFP84_13980 [Actinomycetota bacterium]
MDTLMLTHEPIRLGPTPRTLTGAATAIDARLLDGPLGRAGAVAVVDDIVDATTVAALACEALTTGTEAERQCGATHAVDARRGDVAGRALGSGGGGPVQDTLYRSPQLLARLGALCGATVQPTGGRGSYSYYTRPGDHLDLHVDVPRCDVTLITVLQDSTPTDDPGGALAVWADHIGASLDEIRSTGAPPTATIKVPQGSSVVLLGGLLPHAVLPLGTTGTRVISPLCFAAS